MRKLAKKVCLLKLVATLAAINSIMIAGSFYVGWLREEKAVVRFAETARQVCEVNNVQNAVSRGVFEKRLRDDPGTPELEAELREAIKALSPQVCEDLPALRPEAKEERRIP